MPFDTEMSRVEQFTAILQKYIKFDGFAFQMDMKRMDIFLVVNSNPVVIIEAKNEEGHGKVDSFKEVIGYYVKELRNSDAIKF